MSSQQYQPSDRRPIQSRNTRWAERVTNSLVRLRVSPNAISIFGMFAAILAGLAFAATSYQSEWSSRACWLAGAALCQLRLLCNLFDGMVAVQRQIASPMGELYNEVPDRISDAAILIGLGYSATGNPVLGFIAALMAVFVAYVRVMANSAGAANDFCGPMAKPQRMAVVTGFAAYMACTPSSWRISVGEISIALLIIIAGCVFTACRRLGRAARQLGNSMPA